MVTEICAVFLGDQPCQFRKEIHLELTGLVTQEDIYPQVLQGVHSLKVPHY
jgi:hypothetical protein